MSVYKKFVFLALLSFIVVGCSMGDGMRIGVHVKHCCPGNYEEYRQYSLQAENIPVFLRDYVLMEFDSAMLNKGLTRNEGDKQLNILLKYNHVNLAVEQESIDPFVQANGMNDELHYMAVIEVEMIEDSTGELVWAGSISRLHHVYPGEYMHQERARPEFQSAFNRLLEAYPSS